MLALVALLCTAALQLQEAGHGHGVDVHDSYAECLLCKGSGPVAAIDNTATGAVPVAERPQPVAMVAPLWLTPSRTFLARGPPTYS